VYFVLMLFAVESMLLQTPQNWIISAVVLNCQMVQCLLCRDLRQCFTVWALLRY